MQKRFLFTLALCQALVFGTVLTRGARADVAEEAMKKLEGNWTVVSAVSNGEKMPDEDAKKMKFVIGGNKITVTERENSPEIATLKLDPSKTPAWMDITPDKGPSTRPADATVAAIYKLDGDTLQICFNKDSNKDRPKDFSDPKSSLLTLKKQP
jgi:uncharacterized protein (TIGR03067 family)